MFLLFSFPIASCRKLVEAPAPITGLNGATVYSTNATAIGVLTGMLGDLSSNSLMFSLYPALGADDLSMVTSAAGANRLYYLNNLSSTTNGFEIWNFLYKEIFFANSAIEGLNNATALTPAIKQQLLGEAKFLRAFYYFYLVNYYGDVPLATSTDYTVNSLLTRTPKAKVWEQIIADLKDSQNLLTGSYFDASLLKASTDRVRPNKWVATALLARAYLFTGDYPNAQIQSTSLISTTSLFGLSAFNNVFLKASSGNNEAIWQLPPVLLNYNSQEARQFVLPSAGPSLSFPMYLNPRLVNAFESGDQRLTNWTGNVTVGGTTYYYAYKYKINTTAPVTEHQMIFRLAEQYLIRAEAEANGAGGGVNAAIADLNIIRTRAGLPNYNGVATQSALMTAILHERQVELFTEFGHRWLDLKRSGTIDAVMGGPAGATASKGGTWTSNAALYPLAATEIQNDFNLTQNPGY